MVRSKGFQLEVLIGGVPVKEFPHEGDHLFALDLDVPGVTYRKQVEQVYQGEMQRGDWPFTPYTLRVTNTTPEAAWVYAHIDGREANRDVVKPGQSVIIKGFKVVQGDSVVTNEFCLSLPRYARDEDDHLDAAMRAQLGTVEVRLFDATYLNQAEGAEDFTSSFDQANKKDVANNRNVAGGTAAGTTAQGRAVAAAVPTRQMMHYWSKGAEIVRLQMKSRMPAYLRNLGLLGDNEPAAPPALALAATVAPAPARAAPRAAAAADAGPSGGARGGGAQASAGGAAGTSKVKPEGAPAGGAAKRRRVGGAASDDEDDAVIDLT